MLRAFFLLLLGAPHILPAQEMLDQRFYPFPRDAWWDYQEMDTERNEFHEERITREEESVVWLGETWSVLRGRRFGNVYWVRGTREGVFLAKTCRKIPLLGSINVTFDPPIPFLKFPLQKGDRWIYEGKGVTWIKNRSFRMEFENTGLGEYRTPRGPVSAWRIEATVHMGKNREYHQVSWYGLDLGYLGGSDDTSRTWIAGWNLSGPVASCPENR